MAVAPNNYLVTTVCDKEIYLTASQRDAIVNNMWACLDDFQGFKYYRIQTWARESNHLPASRVGCYFGSVAMAKLQGIAYWEIQMLLHEQTHVCDGFDAAMLQQWMDNAEIHYTESKQDIDAQKPTIFNYDEWID